MTPVKHQVRNPRQIVLAFVSLLAAALLVLALWLLNGAPAQAQVGTGILRVATTGSDAPGCGGVTSPCRTVQYAVDLAQPGDEIRVATGVYTDVHSRAGITQVAYVSKSVALRGGYTTSNWDVPDPEANPSTLDAGGQGRVLYITGAITPTVEGLRITGGDATGLGGGIGSQADGGGGVYVYRASATISNCMIYSNTASTTRRGHGGGLYFEDNYSATLSTSVVQSNTASTADVGYGGGGFLCLNVNFQSRGNTLANNIASTAATGHGGGMFLYWYADVTFVTNTIHSNIASTAAEGYGGGLYPWFGTGLLQSNVVQSNVASTTDDGRCGGLYLRDSATMIMDTLVVSNTATLNSIATGHGGGICVHDGWIFTATNTLVADNHANTESSGLWLEGTSGNPTSAHLLHTTIANNHGGSGQGIHVGPYATLALTNTILSGHSVGIHVTAGSTARLEGTLWHDNGADTGGAGTILTGTVNVHGDPAFLDPAAWDYHLGSGSAAIDAGVDAGVTTDVDGDPRPLGGYDIGADEYVYPVRLLLPLALRQ
jgi:hypothetical protein